MNKDQYIAAEPEEFQSMEVEGRSVFRDMVGGFHASREAAIEASFNMDLQRAAEELSMLHGSLLTEMIAERAHLMFLRLFVNAHPDMVRVLLGDRDATG